MDQDLLYQQVHQADRVVPSHLEALDLLGDRGDLLGRLIQVLLFHPFHQAIQGDHGLPVNPVDEY